MTTEDEIATRLRDILAPYGERVHAADRADRGVALTAAAATLTSGARSAGDYGFSEHRQARILEILLLAERYAIWIKTGDDSQERL